MKIQEYKIERYPGLKPKIVVIGGGTGLSTLLRGLKKYTPNITAIVTVADDGGHSGNLRKDLGILPPGDIRACLLALANTEPSMEKLLNYRFQEGNLEGHNIGNLLIAAMNGIYGSFDEAIKEMSNVLAVKGKVLPMTLSDVQLCAVLKNGEIVQGESKIPQKALDSMSTIDRIYMEPRISFPLNEAVEAIKQADLIVLGPGSLYTSVIPNLLVNDIVGKIKNAPGKKVYITNVMTQPGETDFYSIYDHVNAILKHSREDFLDYVIGNLEPIEDYILDKYIEDGSKPVKVTDIDLEKLDDKKIKFIGGNLISIKNGFIRHNTENLSRILISIAGSTMEVKETIRL